MHLDQALGIALADSHGRRSDQPEQDGAIADLQLGNRRALGEAVLVAVPQLERDPRIARQREAPAGQRAIEPGFVSLLFGVGFHDLTSLA